MWFWLFVSDIYLLIQFKNQLNKSKTFRLKSLDQKCIKSYVKQVKKKKNLISLKIWLNNFIIMILRLIELAFNLHIFLMVIMFNFCLKSEKICDNYLEFGNLFFLITCSYLIVTYYLLNKLFKNEFKKFLNVFSKNETLSKFTQN